MALFFSAFFAQPITVALLYSQTSSYNFQDVSPVPLTRPNHAIIDNVSPSRPLVQTRRVNLICASRIVCTATSTVRITCPTSARLFIGEKYAIGQVFRELGKVPRFDLIAVGIGGSIVGEEDKLAVFADMKRHELWRKYKVDCEGFECEILEVFPTREMFTRGNTWLDEQFCGEKKRLFQLSLPSLVTEAKRPTRTLAFLFTILFLLSFLVYRFLHLSIGLSSC
jgi:hypothetical protein